jgi:hypothetical protein
MTPFSAGVAVRNIYEIIARAPSGIIKWRDEVKNLTTNQGLDEILTQFWAGNAYTAAHAVGLMGATPTIAATDTMASHPGWSEFADYTGVTRAPLTLGPVVVQSISNSASKAVFSIASTGTVGGAFVTTDDVKGGVGGVLMGGAAFLGGDRQVAAGDSVELAVTLTAASL